MLIRNLFALLMIFSCSGHAKHPPLPTVDYVDINRYLGTWYEIARFDNSFQRGCTATKATYSLRKKNQIDVLNECRRDNPNGKLKKAKGRAWITDTDTNAKLKVQFFLRFLRIPLFAGDYWILDLDENYQHVIVGTKNRKYLWFLARTPNLEEMTIKQMKVKAKNLGFDINNLMMTEH